MNASPDSTRLIHCHLRILATHFTIRTNGSEVEKALEYLRPHAEQCVPVTRHVEIDVIWSGERCLIRSTGYPAGTETCLSAICRHLFALIHDIARESLADHIGLHALSGTHNGRAYLVVGPKRTGKTTLAMQLLSDAFDVTGDELVFLKAGQALPFPRNFYVRHSSLALVPGLEALCRAAPATISATEGRLVAVDPSLFGKPWVIRPRTLSTIVFLEPRHAGRSAMAFCSKSEMVRRILPESQAPSTGRQGWFGELCQTVNSARTTILQLGDLPSASVALQNLFSYEDRSYIDE